MEGGMQQLSVEEELAWLLRAEAAAPPNGLGDGTAGAALGGAEPKVL